LSTGSGAVPRVRQAEVFRRAEGSRTLANTDPNGAGKTPGPAVQEKSGAFFMDAAGPEDGKMLACAA